MAATLFAAFLILFMQAGFALTATGLCRAKNAAHTMATHLLIVAVAVLPFFFFGYALMGDGPVRAWSSHWVFHHSRGYLLQADKSDGLALSWFLLMSAYAAVAAAIFTGAMCERWRLRSFVVFVFVLGGLLFPVFGCWIWNGGWLAQLGRKAHWGHGAVDSAGACTVHVLGGTLAFALAWFIRPRIGKYDEAGRPRPILGHHLPMVVLGTLVLAFGWFGFTAARSLALGEGRAPLIAVNTLLSGVGGVSATTVYVWLRYARPDPSLICNGLIAGLVAICGSCEFVAPWAALVIGAVGGVVAVWGLLGCERLGLDDPVGATGVHGMADIWGTLALGLFADGSFGAQYNGVAGPVVGLFYGGGGRQLLCQAIAVAACVIWALAAGGGLFAVVDRIVGGSRVSPGVELAGLDIPETGAPGYAEFISYTAPDDSQSAGRDTP